MDAMYRQIEVALVVEELHDALDVVSAGVRARHQVLEGILASDLGVGAGDDSDVDGWDDASQIEYRKEVLGQTVYRALFITCWSAFEQLMTKLCSDVKWDLGLSLSERELAGRGVERSMKYLRKAAGIEIDLNEWKWPVVRRYGRLRNHLVHVGPNADDANDPRSARRDFGALPGVRIEPAGEIVVDESFVRESIRSVQHLLIGIDKSIQAGLENGRLVRANPR